MNEILGLVDAFEAIIMEGKKLPFSDMVLLDEKILLDLLGKIRNITQNEGSIARKSVDITKNSFNEHEEEEQNTTPLEQTDLENEVNIIKKKADKFKIEADDYADFIMANLQLMIAKMQKNMVMLEKNIENGRTFLEKRKKENDEEQKVTQGVIDES
ncbi:hypothetical protein ACFLZV_05075 [Candidatus Margulisiibacteriota bacterium]